MSPVTHIAGIPYSDYIKIYLIIVKGFPMVMRKKNDETTIHPSKFCNVPFEQLEEIYDCIKLNFPHLFDTQGNIIRKKNHKKSDTKKMKKKIEKPIQVTFN